MAGRLAWIIAGGAAVVGGWAIQDGVNFSFDGDREQEEAIQEAIDEVRREPGINAKVVVPGERRDSKQADTVEAFTDAVADLVKAETALASARLDQEDDPEGFKAAEVRRDQARVRVEQLRAEIEAIGEPASARAETRDAVREAVRTEARDAIRNN